MNNPSTREVVLRDLWQRNALRRTAQLPLLDIKEELELALHQQAVTDYYAARKELDHLRPALEQKWIARQQRRRPGYTPNRNSIWHMMLGAHVNMVLDRILRKRTGRVHPGWAGKMIGYGGGISGIAGDDA